MSRSVWNGSQWIGAPASAPETPPEAPETPPEAPTVAELLPADEAPPNSDAPA